MHWESLRQGPSFALRRSGRYLVAELHVPHQVMSTSARHGGQVDHLTHLVNHQSCEGSGHDARHRVISEAGLDAYHDRVCADIGLPAPSTAVMGTAANMNYAAVTSDTDDDVTVTVAVTAGVHGNATTAGEPAPWRETDGAYRRAPRYAGTINTMLLLDRPLTAAALARAVVTMTEGKTAALHRLAVPSTRHQDLATGTGTDQYCVAAPLSEAPPRTSASPHVTLGELIGRTTRQATLEALRWQNGLEASYTRGAFHALGRYGVTEATLLDDIAPLVSEDDLALLAKNMNAVFYEPLVGSTAHALATVCDRVRYGTLPATVAADAKVQQAASLAANLAARLDRWPEFRARLHPHADGDVKTLVLRAVALGWSEKWRT